MRTVYSFIAFLIRQVGSLLITSILQKLWKCYIDTANTSKMSSMTSVLQKTISTILIQAVTSQPEPAMHLNPKDQDVLRKRIVTFRQTSWMKTIFSPIGSSFLELHARIQENGPKILDNNG